MKNGISMRLSLLSPDIFLKISGDLNNLKHSPSPFQEKRMFYIFIPTRMKN